VLAASFLAAHGAEFVVIGGCALRMYGRDHVPADLDVVPEPSLLNLRRLFDALSTLGTVGGEWRPGDHALETRDVMTKITPIGSIDVLLARGREGYVSLAYGALSMPVSGHGVRVAAIDEVERLRVRFGKVAVGG